MNIMKEWLDDYNEAEEYSKIVNDTKKNTCQCSYRHGYYMVNGNCNSTSCRSKEKLKRGKMESKNFININSRYPSEFMKDFIEATYNLFQIQQKRIEELEGIVKLTK